MSPLNPVPQFAILINKVPLLPNIAGYVSEVIVDTNVFMPSMCTIILEDEPNITGLLKFVDDVLLFRIGAMVDVSALITKRQTQMPDFGSIFSGEITSIEPVFMEDSRVRFRIRAHDLGHRLTLGKKTRAFGGLDVPTVTDMQIVATLAGENGLAPKIEPSSLLYNFVMQNNQSDWDFLWERASMLGYDMYVDGRFLNFVKAGSTRGFFSPADLEWRNNLLRFEPRISTAGAVTGVDVTGWDESMKKQVAGSSSGTPGSKYAKIPGALIPGSKAITMGYMITKAKDVIMDPSITNQRQAETIAKSRFEEHESQFVRASGEAFGDPHLVAGKKVNVSKVGVRFSGEYYITEAKHIFRSGGYRVKFEVSGRSPYTLRHMLMGKEKDANKIFGCMIGVVTNINDLKMQGRVKVKFPWLDEQFESSWARVAAPGAGKERGMYFSPEVDDEVLVAFEHGNINAPIVIGGLWNGKDKPPNPSTGKAVLGSEVNKRVIRSRSGHLIELDDTQGAEKLLIQDKTGNNKIEIDSTKRTMLIKSAGDMTLEVGGKLTIKCTQDFIVESNTKAQITAKTGAVIKVDPAELNLAPSGTALKGTKVDVQSQATLGLQGIQTSLKGTAMVEIQGGIVKIN